MVCARTEMSEQLDYVNSCIENARSSKLERLISGNIQTIEALRYEVGYLKAMQDVMSFQRDYTDRKNPRKTEED